MRAAKRYPSGGSRLVFAAVASAATSFAIGGLVYLAGWLAILGNQEMYHTAQIELQDAINATCVLFWVVFAIFYCTHVHRSSDARDDERRALISEAWLEGRRARLLRRRSRRGPS